MPIRSSVAVLAATMLCSAARADTKAAIYYVPTGLSERQAALFGAHLQAELEKLEGLTVVKSGAPSGAQDQACAESRSCLVRLAEAAGGDVVVIARAASVGEMSVVTLKRLHILSGEISQSVTKQLGGSGQEFLLAIGPAVTELFPEHAVREGEERGVAAPLVLRWTPPPLSPPVFWTVVGLSGAGVVATTLFGLRARSAEREHADYVASGEEGSGVVDGRRLLSIEGRAQAAARNTNIALAATATMAIGSALIWFFTDWDSELDAAVLVDGL